MRIIHQTGAARTRVAGDGIRTGQELPGEIYQFIPNMATAFAQRGSGRLPGGCGYGE